MVGCVLELSDQVLGLADIEGLAQDAVGGEQLLRVIGEAEDDFGMPDGEAFVAEVGLDFGGEFEEAEGIGDDGAAFADACGGFLLGQLELIDQLGKPLGFFDRVEVFALQVFDESQFERSAVIRLADEDGDLGEAGEASGAPAAFAGDQFVAVIGGADDQGLHDALGADGVGEVLE